MLGMLVVALLPARDHSGFQTPWRDLSRAEKILRVKMVLATTIAVWMALWVLFL